LRVGKVIAKKAVCSFFGPPCIQGGPKKLHTAFYRSLLIFLRRCCREDCRWHTLNKHVQETFARNLHGEWNAVLFRASFLYDTIRYDNL